MNRASGFLCVLVALLAGTPLVFADKPEIATDDEWLALSRTITPSRYCGAAVVVTGRARSAFAASCDTLLRRWTEDGARLLESPADAGARWGAYLRMLLATRADVVATEVMAFSVESNGTGWASTYWPLRTSGPGERAYVDLVSAAQWSDTSFFFQLSNYSRGQVGPRAFAPSFGLPDTFFGMLASDARMWSRSGGDWMPVDGRAWWEHREFSTRVCVGALGVPCLVMSPLRSGDLVGRQVNGAHLGVLGPAVFPVIGVSATMSESSAEMLVTLFVVTSASAPPAEQLQGQGVVVDLPSGSRITDARQGNLQMYEESGGSISLPGMQSRFRVRSRPNEIAPPRSAAAAASAFATVVDQAMSAPGSEAEANPPWLVLSGAVLLLCIVVWLRRRMRSAAIAVLLSLSCGVGCGQGKESEAGMGASRATSEPHWIDVDFGVAEPAEGHLVRSIGIPNRDANPVTVTRVVPYCECIGILERPRKLAGGEEGALVVSVPAQGSVGTWSYEVAVFVEGRDTPMALVRLHGRRLSPVATVPNEVHLLAIGPNDPSECQVALLAPSRPEEVSVSADPVTLVSALEETEQDGAWLRTYKVHIKPPPGVPHERRHHVITFRSRFMDGTIATATTMIVVTPGRERLLWPSLVALRPTEERAGLTSVTSTGSAPVTLPLGRSDGWYVLPSDEMNSVGAAGTRVYVVQEDQP